MNRKKIKFLIFFSLISLFLSFSLVLAQGDRKLEINYPIIGNFAPETVATGLPEYVKYIFNFAVIISGFVIFGVLIYNGLIYLSSVGNPAKMSSAREGILAAFLGAIILLSSYLILATINPQLVSFPPLSSLFRTEKWCAKEKKDIPIGDWTEARCITPGGVEPEEMTLIAYEIPLGQMMEEGIWSETKTEYRKELIEDFEEFLSEEILSDPPINRIADLNKYLKDRTDKCQCGELNQLCSQPADGCVNDRCSGDPCPDEIRDEIDDILEKNKNKIEKLLEFQKKFIDEAMSLEGELDKFSEGLEDALDCLTQSKEIYTLPEHLARVQFYEDRGWEVKTVKSSLESRGDPLTFYCSVGGPAMDFPQAPNIEFIPGEMALPDIPEKVEKVEPMSCPVEVPIGEIIQNIGGLGTVTSTTMRGIDFQIGEMVKEIRNMAVLVSQCNEQNCEPNCGCLITHPCYKKYGIPWCSPYTENPCVQCSGECTGEACPRTELAETVEKIKKIEDEIFAIIGEGKQIFPQLAYNVSDVNNPINLKDVRTVIKLCHGPASETEPPTWFMMGCPLAMGNYGPNGQLIGACHPWNFFCCTSSKENLKNMPSFPRSLRSSRQYTLQQAPAPDPAFGESTRSLIPSLHEQPSGIFTAGAVPCLRQSDGRWGNIRYGNQSYCTTYSAAGCGPTSLAMVLSYFQGSEIRTDTVGQQIVSKGLRPCNDGSYQDAMRRIPQEFYGLSSTATNPRPSCSTTKNIMKDCFGAGGLIVGHWRCCDYTSGGHFMALVGMKDDNTVILHDTHGGRGVCPRDEPFDKICRTLTGFWCIK